MLEHLLCVGRLKEEKASGQGFAKALRVGLPPLYPSERWDLYPFTGPIPLEPPPPAMAAFCASVEGGRIGLSADVSMNIVWWPRL